MQKVDFFMDTSYFVQEDWGKYRKKAEKYIVVNLNSNGEKFFNEMLPLVKSYQEKGYLIYYVPISKSHDADITYYQWFLDAGIDQGNFKILDWEQDFEAFLSILANAEQVI